uniref:Uncharacterized protein n=1 Tax=viral metagenome TaxID=1070528 RepID=A0A6M3KBG5_9ZZZZ
MNRLIIILIIILAIVPTRAYATPDYRPEPVPFTSVEELSLFLVADDTDNTLFLTAGKDGIIQFNGQCEDYAFNLQKRAKEAGYIMETELLSKTDCIKWKKYIEGDPYSLGYNDAHMIDKVYIGNEVWFIEPANDNKWNPYRLD